MTQTTNLGLQKLINVPLQAGGGGVLLPNGERSGDPNKADGGYNDLVEAIDGGLIRKITVEFPVGSPLVVTVTDALAYGSAQLVDLADTNYIIFAAEADFVCTKDGAGILAAEQPNVAVGTAAASNATLTGAMINVIDITQLAGTLVAAFEEHSNGNASPGLVFLGDAAANQLFLNVAVNPTGDGTLSVTGRFDVYLLDVGNLTS